MKSLTSKTVIWDNTNIGENYPGVTSPLTFSFIQEAYAEVYAHFLRRIGVSEKHILDHTFVLQNMLGYIRGHVYYHIEHWYTFLTFLPGYHHNKQFFESMLDPYEKKASRELPEIHVKTSRFERFSIGSRFALAAIFFPFLQKRFETTVQSLFAEFRKTNINKLPAITLLQKLSTLKHSFFTIWAITIINDFKVMILFGLLNKCIQKWGKDERVLLQDIYSLSRIPRSVLPLQDIVSIARTIQNQTMYRALWSHSPDEVYAKLSQKKYSSLKRTIETYLKTYGDRSANELKLEEFTFREKPSLFIHVLSQFVHMPNAELYLLEQVISRKKSHVPVSYDLSLIQKIIYSFLKHETIKGIYRREYFRMKRGEAFGIARTMYLAIGKELSLSGQIGEDRDIMYLSASEIADYVEHHALPTDLKQLISKRKIQMKQYQKQLLPRRIRTTGFPGEDQVENLVQKNPKSLHGKGTSQGVVTTDCIVVTELDYTLDYRNKILVTVATDPGWTVIFPLLKGIITEQGGTLSHASIIARELSIPCIVQVANATTHVKTGQSITLDAMQGTVIIHA